ncbi:MAG: class I SAM-dependent methyltransferase [Candidatus Gottesmanbacteria bacterium]
MMDFNERVIPGQSMNFLYQQALSRYQYAKNLIKIGSKIVDLGCGVGYGSALLSDIAPVIGIDISNEAIAYAKKNYGKNVVFETGDINKLKFTNNEVDVVCAFEVIEHIEKPDKLLYEVKRILNNNGQFFLSTPNREIMSEDGQLTSPYHKIEYDFQEIQALLRQFFRNVEVLGQRKSKKADNAYKSFIKSQTIRQNIVNFDKFYLRKLFTQLFKEKMWQKLGNLFGRQHQEQLTSLDFPITKNDSINCDYFFIICQK